MARTAKTAKERVITNPGEGPEYSKLKQEASNTKATATPKTVLDKVVYAIRKQPGASSAKGVSRAAIAKYLKVELEYDNANAIKSALKKGVDKGILTQTGHSFRVKKDPIKEDKQGPKLEITDLAVGEGGTENNDNSNQVEAQIGDSVTVKYSGKLDDGYEFDNADSFTFTLGAGDVIKGWDQGVKGMRVGGKRKLVVPSQLGYGKRGCAPDIPANATLYFLITLKDIVRPSEG